MWWAGRTRRWARRRRLLLWSGVMIVKGRMWMVLISMRVHVMRMMRMTTSDTTPLFVGRAVGRWRRGWRWRGNWGQASSHRSIPRRGGSTGTTVHAGLGGPWGWRGCSGGSSHRHRVRSHVAKVWIVLVVAVKIGGHAGGELWGVHATSDASTSNSKSTSNRWTRPSRSPGDRWCLMASVMWMGIVVVVACSVGSRGKIRVILSWRRMMMMVVITRSTSTKHCNGCRWTVVCHHVITFAGAFTRSTSEDFRFPFFFPQLRRNSWRNMVLPGGFALGQGDTDVCPHTGFVGTRRDLQLLWSSCSTKSKLFKFIYLFRNRYSHYLFFYVHSTHFGLFTFTKYSSLNL